jgi:hypothetical protein
LILLVKSKVISQKMSAFCTNYANTWVSTQNIEKLSLDWIFIDNFCQNIKSFCKQNSMLGIHSKPDRNWQELTVCTPLR